ncbi:MAG: sulfite reductase subunit alpha [Rhodocyclaceae bacterium]
MISTELPRLAAAGVLVAAYAGLCLRIWAGQRTRRHSAAAPERGGKPVLVAYASQTGFARELAEDAAQALAAAGVSARVAALGDVDADTLRDCEQALFVAATSGEGDAPDNAARFADGPMHTAPPLTRLRYGLLALGDRSYNHFCGFGRRLDTWLAGCGAHALFPRVELDRADASALATWRHRLADFAGVAELPEAAAPEPGYWRLRSSRLLNPGSAGCPVHHVELEAVAGPGPDAVALALPHWEAGDLLQIFPPGEGDHSRDQPRAYSIASLPADAAVHLLVRAVRGTDGTPGRMSTLLTTQARPGTTFRARLRAHPNFREGDNAGRPLILIGNGTGLAGLAAHLRQRVRRGDGRTWLVFGERHAAHDDFLGDELDALEHAGLLARCDRVWSRDGNTAECGTQPAHREYVQHRLVRAAATLHDWVAGGAAIYVCGNAVGMGPAVHAVLEEVLGTETLAELSTTGRYRRDIY